MHPGLNLNPQGAGTLTTGATEKVYDDYHKLSLTIKYLFFYLKKDIFSVRRLRNYEGKTDSTLKILMVK